MLTKNVKDILEGMHFFLDEGLKAENLSGKAECMRRGLLLQLQVLHQTYPTLQFTSTDTNHNRPSALLNYINNDKNAQSTVNSSRLSTSSGSTNYSTGYSNTSSIGYSGDGIIASPDKIAAENSSIEEHEDEGDNEELYEEFDDNRDFTSIENSANTSLQNGENPPKLPRSLDDSYATDGDLIPFRVLIARCDYHGVLVKKSKTFLKNSRYQCVLANGMLYLYHRESDDRQRKLIDLLKYSARSILAEEHKKKKEFSFELTASGKKSHTFSATTHREREQWIVSLNTSLPVNVTRLDSSQKTSVTSFHNQSFGPEDHLTNEDEEVYEELNTEDEMDGLHSRIGGRTTTDSMETYYEVPDDEEDDFTRNPSEVSSPRRPPERPPLPEILKELKQQSRPLPIAPCTSLAEEDDDPSIYWEIDYEDSFDNDDSELQTAEVNTRLLHSRSLSQEIFDTINERVPILPDRQHKLSDPHLETEEDDFEYDVPAEINLVIRENQTLNGLRHSFDCTFDHSDTEYQVPTNSAPVPSIYQVPSSHPIPVKALVQDSPTDSDFDELPTPKVTEEKRDPDPTTLHDEPSPTEPQSVKALIAKLNRTGSQADFTRRTSLRQINVAKLKPIAKDQGFESEPEVCPTSPKPDEVTDNKKSTLLASEIEKLKFELKMRLLSNNDSNASGLTKEIYIAKFAYVGSRANELSFSRGEPIVVTGPAKDATWWQATAKGKAGVVQKGYLRKNDS